MAFRPLAMALADLLCPWDELRWRGNDLLCPWAGLLCPSDDLLWRGNELLWFWTTCHAFWTVCYGFSSTCCLFRWAKRDTWPSRAWPRRASRRARRRNWASVIVCMIAVAGNKSQRDFIIQPGVARLAAPKSDGGG